ncbi:embryo defective [Forsythia ovata]|uniref:Embryo defective n=1 Tax=Forsythia ovata TaxID=205694 RepID=A0ABD1PJ94_9LAMI
MGRPEPCVLFAQTFVHPNLKEYVDEVLFAEPVVITACEFLEQNASSACSAVKLMGATSPPSFALEVFVHCEGETRFRRLCQPCLYSHSSSNVLEIESVVTNHLVIRGSYRSLSMVIYGNTAEDLGQFNIEVDLDSSWTDNVSAIEGKLEDLPPAFRPMKPTIEELVFPLKILSQTVVALDIPLEIKKFLHLAFKIFESPNLGVAADKVLSSLLSVASIYATPHLSHETINQKQFGIDILRSGGEAHHVLTEARKELSDVFKSLRDQSRGSSAEFSAESSCFEYEVPTSKELVDTLYERFDFCCNSGNVGYPQLSQNKNTIMLLSAALLLCSARESCFHFVNYGGMTQLGYAFTHRTRNSTTLTILLLGVIEQATRHSIGCEGFLGWWPREDESIPSGNSDGYNQLLKLLLQNQKHDIASLATYILHRMRFYEVACRYECAMVSVLGVISSVGHATNFTLDMLASAKAQLKKLLKLINSRGPIEDPSPMAAASRFFILDDAGLLPYSSTSGLIKLSNCCFSNWDVDPHLLSLLKERGFLPLSAALLSSSILGSETGHALDLLLDIVSHIEAIILSLLFCRSGLTFLLHDPEVSSMIFHALRGVDDVRKEDSISLRYASVLVSKNFFCRPQEVSLIIEMHVRAISAVDNLLTLAPDTEEFLWLLWDLCRLSRSECGRQALLALVNFPEALSVLMTALHSGRELDPIAGVSPLSLAIFHAASEILEVIVTDSTASSLASWIDHAKELHRVLHSSSPGSNKKDAPARLLEWIDAGVVYQRNGAIGLLRYAAVLASGGDAHMASNSVLASDVMDVDNVVGDSSSNSDGNIIDNLLGKRITEKDFAGVILRDSSVAQLTAAFRILAFISDNSDVAAALYDEGAVMVIHAVMINCKLMLERASNIYDYLVDEGTEGNSTSDLLLERYREKSLVDLLIPPLVLLINLLQKLEEAKEQHRNTKLMNALLQLHREVSPKLAACAADLCYPCPDSALGFETVCHLLASALACWPVYGWTPGLFHFLLDNIHTTSVLSLGPKETCSLLCLLNDLFPDESIWLWKNGTPMLTALRSLSVGTLLGSQKEKQVNWYLLSGHPEKLVCQLSPHLVKLAEVVLHCAISTSVVIQDMLRVFIIRIANLNIDNASVLLQPIVLWISHRLSEPLTLSDVDAYKGYRLLSFLGCLLEHPNGKSLLLKEGGVQMLTKVLERCIAATNSDVKQFPENRNVAKDEFYLLSWCVPVFKSISLISDARASVQCAGANGRCVRESLTAEECIKLLSYLLKFSVVLPVGKELVACLSAFKEMGSSTEGQSALLSIFMHIRSSGIEISESQSRRESDGRYNLIDVPDWREHPPLLCCWTALLRSIVSKDISPVYTAAAIVTLSTGALRFCMDGESLNLERVAAVKFFFRIKNESSLDGFVEESMKHIEEFANLLESETSSDAYSAAGDLHPTSYEVKESANSLMLLLQKSTDTMNEDVSLSSLPSSLVVSPVPSRVHKIANSSIQWMDDYSLDEFGDEFFWECPENLRDRLAQTGLPQKRKISSLEGPNRRARGDNAAAEAITQSTFSRGSVPLAAPSGPTRRDTFRQRKPNTSRPPSMHVDDYVARERNADGTNPNVIAVPRIGSTSGRPPSIHVDEFMARQRERQNSVGSTGTDTTAQVQATAPENNTDVEKYSKPQKLKPDLDDDLQGIDIVFDAEESEPDDKLMFPQPDGHLQQPPSVVVEQRSPHSIVEETDTDVNEGSHFSRLGTPLASNMDENTPSEFSSRMSASRPELSLTREPSISSGRKFPDQSEDLKNFPVQTPRIDSPAGASGSGISTPGYANTPSSTGQLAFGSRAPPAFYSQANFPQSGIVPLSGGSQGFYDKKFPLNQPPLPPMPPPPTVSPVLSQSTDTTVQSEYLSVLASNSSLATSSPLPDSRFGRTSLSSPGGSGRLPPPLPPTPPPYSSNPSGIPSFKNPNSPSPMYVQTVGSSELQQNPVAPSMETGLGNPSASRTMLTSYPPPPSVQPLLFRPGSVPISLYGNSLVPHHGENLPSISQNHPLSLPPFHSIPPLTQLQPLQPPQIPRPPPQHLRPSIPASPQSEQGVSVLQSPLQVPQLSPAHMYYQARQQDNASHSSQQFEQSRVQHQQADGTSQQQDSGMSLQEYFKSPEAIQSLLSDRDKLCQLLEEHPKLMQMLQERLGHL